MTPYAFRKITNFLGPVSLIYLYLDWAELYTGFYYGVPAETIPYRDLVFWQFALLFWGFIIFGLVFPFIVFTSSLINRKYFNLKLATLACLILVIMFWIRRYIIVVPALQVPLFIWEIGVYNPTWADWAIQALIVTIPVLMFTLFLKFFPIVPVTETKELVEKEPESLEWPLKEKVEKEPSNVLSEVPNVRIPDSTAKGV